MLNQQPEVKMKRFLVLLSLLLCSALLAQGKTSDNNAVRSKPDPGKSLVPLKREPLGVLPKKSNGFGFSHVVPGSIYARLGFKRGDIIESVNGKPASHPKQTEAAFPIPSKPGKYIVRVKRAGKMTTLRYTIK